MRPDLKFFLTGIFLENPVIMGQVFLGKGDINALSNIYVTGAMLHFSV